MTKPSNQPQITHSVEKATQALLSGELVAIPTETVYGLAADATNPTAISNVFALKNRPADHPLIVHCSSAAQAWQCASSVSSAAKCLADSFWPGPLTLVLPRSETINPIVTGGQDSVAIRVPSHVSTQQLLLQVERPLVAPSANRFGRVSPTTAEHVRDEFPDCPLLILDGGACEVGIESTIVDCRSENSIRVLRPGKITNQQLIRELGETGQLAAETDVSTVRVSGALPSHYAPRAKVIVLEATELLGWCTSNSTKDLPTFLISPQMPPEDLPAGIHWHCISSDTLQFAHEMYALLRQADQQSFERIVVELPPAEGIGLALRDRLQRAAN